MVENTGYELAVIIPAGKELVCDLFEHRNLLSPPPMPSLNL
jgi:hypothetical protein